LAPGVSVTKLFTRVKSEISQKLWNFDKKCEIPQNPKSNSGLFKPAKLGIKGAATIVRNAFSPK